MKARIIPAIIGAVLACGLSVSQADVILFGHLDTSFDATDQDGGSDDVNFECTTCSVGFKGSEELGNGLKAIFLLDYQFDMFNRNGDSSNPTAITDRDQYLGLAGNFGQVVFGTMSTVYKSHGAMIDPLYRTALQGRDRGLQSDFHNGAGENLEGRADNSVRYDSPDWNGLSVGAIYTLDSNADDGETNDPYGIGVSYSNDSFLAYADYEDNNGDNTDVGGSVSAWKVGGKYELGMLALYGQYEDASIDMGTDTDLMVWHVGASATLGNSMAYFAYGRGKYDYTGSSSDDYTSWTLAAIHNLSKRTMLYAGYNGVDCDAQVADTVCGDVGPSGGEDEKVSIGMKHKF